MTGAPHGGRTSCGGLGACAGACDGSNANACAFPDMNRETVKKNLRRAAERGELANPLHGHYGPPWSDEQ